MTTLISFLGKSQRKDGKYRDAIYRFDDQARQTTFFGKALAEHLNPKRLILIGTSGSMWDVFFEDGNFQNDTALEELIDSVHQNAVTEAMLQVPAEHFSQQLGYPVECLLIDYAQNEKGQVDLLSRLADKLSENESVTLDVTHSFRHLPMLALVAARFLTRVKRIKVEDIYYGALEMTENGEAPVVRLKGLLDLLDWVDALASYDKDGDYGVFASLLSADGMPEDRAKALRNAAFFERVNHIEGARQNLTPTLEAIETHSGLFGRLFKQELESRIYWARNPERGQRELALAKTWLARRDYLRCAIFLLEGLITKEVFNHKENQNNHDDREKARDALKDQNLLFKKLDWLRNALAHGQRSQNQDVNQLLSDETRLRQMLEQCFNEFAP
jgi:CRISPR-associated Csx2 family protein